MGSNMINRGGINTPQADCCSWTLATSQRFEQWAPGSRSDPLWLIVRGVQRTYFNKRYVDLGLRVSGMTNLYSHRVATGCKALRYSGGEELYP